MKPKTDIIILVLLSILLTISSLLISDANNYYKYIRILGYALLIIYIILRFSQKNPIKIVKNKLDIAILLLTGATIIPLVSSTYISLNGTISIVLQYIYAYAIYITIREISIQNLNFTPIIGNTIIILTVIMIIIGIDGITSNQLVEFMKGIGKGDFLNGEDRLISVFGYPNVLARVYSKYFIFKYKSILRAKKTRS